MAKIPKAKPGHLDPAYFDPDDYFRRWHERSDLYEERSKAELFDSLKEKHHEKDDTAVAVKLHEQWDAGITGARSFADHLRKFCDANERADGSRYVPKNLRKLWDQYQSRHRAGPTYPAKLRPAGPSYGFRKR
jgi:hypothetical protein